MKTLKRLIRPFILYQSNYGREFGWYVEYKGQVVGELMNVQNEDMFWESYDLISVGKESDKILHDSENWGNCNFEYRNKGMSLYAKNAFCGGKSPFIFKNRVLMRGLYLRPNIIEELIMLFCEFIDFILGGMKKGILNLIGRNI